jgi:chemotaxis protein histidine kinase CheA
MINPDLLPEGFSGEELMGIYLGSACDMIDQMARCVERGLPQDFAPHIPLVHRLAHNLKGSSCQFGFTETGRVARAMEALAAHLQRGSRAPEPLDLQVLAAAVAVLREHLRDLAHGVSPAGTGELCRRLEERAR